MSDSEPDYLIMSLPKTKNVEDVLNADDGVLKCAKKGTFMIDTSTIGPVQSREFAQIAKDNQMIYCDTPVIGGTPGATNGTLVFLMGAESEE